MAAERVKSMYSTASDTPITLDPELLAQGAQMLASSDSSDAAQQPAADDSLSESESSDSGVDLPSESEEQTGEDQAAAESAQAMAYMQETVVPTLSSGAPPAVPLLPLRDPCTECAAAL